MASELSVNKDGKLFRKAYGCTGFKLGPDSKERWLLPLGKLGRNEKNAVDINRLCMQTVWPMHVLPVEHLNQVFATNASKIQQQITKQTIAMKKWMNLFEATTEANCLIAHVTLLYYG